MAQEDTKLKARLNDAIKGFRGDVGIYVKHLKKGSTVSINADSIFPTASMVKVPLTIGVFNKIKLKKENFRITRN
jgi:beta-lactamase class A